ncbi:transglutaminase-like domain-containing protein [Cerasicoccus arenae]|uniref:transglutaminase-like domain-containing protein n=1 Tax=Cerasicoccus arenae TaxID=424488 RepID=UPI00167BAB0D|nr:transglutaminase-like domain-containing protein [Cerasicoccus arenae]
MNEKNSVPLKTSRKHALLGLLDDTTSSVRTAVRAELERLGPVGVSFLREAVLHPESSVGCAARELLESLTGGQPERVFRDFIRSFHYELETGVLLLDRVANPDVGMVDYERFLAEVSDRCRELLLHPSTAWEKCRILNRVIFGEYGFTGDMESFYDPRNSFLSEVVSRRRGIPISLSILYLLVADRCHLELSPIAFPGRFMVGCFLDADPFYIDVFEGGVFRGIEEIEEMLEPYQIELEPAVFAPCPVGEVLARCCRNLVNQYSREGDSDRVRLFTEYVNEFEAAYRLNDE